MKLNSMDPLEEIFQTATLNLQMYSFKKTFNINGESKEVTITLTINYVESRCYFDYTHVFIDLIMPTQINLLSFDFTNASNQEIFYSWMTQLSVFAKQKIAFSLAG